jgi:hypothetical protein
MTGFQLDLSIQEQKYLAELLSAELKETRVEEHRTRTPSYREHVVQREEIIEGLLRKLGAVKEELAPRE